MKKYNLKKYAVIDTRTGKGLITRKQLLKSVKKYLNSFTDEELIEKLKEQKRKINQRKKEDRNGKIA